MCIWCYYQSRQWSEYSNWCMCVQKITGTRNAWQSSSCSLPGANTPTKPRGYWTKVRHIFSDVQWSSVVLTHASVMQSSHPLWNAGSQNEWRLGMPIFANSCQKSVTIGTSHQRIAIWHAGKAKLNHLSVVMLLLIFKPSTSWLKVKVRRYDGRYDTTYLKLVLWPA